MRPIRLAWSPLLLMLLTVGLPPCAQARALEGDALLSAVEGARARRRAQVRSVSADVVIGMSSKAWAGSGTCQGRLAARRPGSLRLLGYAAVATVFDATTDGERFWLYLPPLGRVITGRATEESLLVALPVLPVEIVSALFGEPYGAPESGLRVIASGGASWIAWNLPDGHEVRARYDASSLLLERAELWAGEERVARLDYHDYRKRRGVWWPTRVEFDWPEERGHLSLTFDQVRFNGKIDDSAFRFEAPEGVMVTSVTDPDPFGEKSR